MTVIPDEEPDEWTAYCAPGMRLITQINLYFHPERVTEVIESPIVEGNQVILVNRSKLYEGWK